MGNMDGTLTTTRSILIEAELFLTLASTCSIVGNGTHHESLTIAIFVADRIQATD
jgi:hypothetical protein